MQPETTFYDNYYGQLVGYTITKVQMVEDDYDGTSWPTFTLTHPSKPPLKIEVSRDEEGNGPGFLFIGKVD